MSRSGYMLEMQVSDGDRRSRRNNSSCNALLEAVENYGSPGTSGDCFSFV
jgi:hypothetical protein